MKDVRIEHDKCLHDASLVGVIDQRRQGYCSASWTGTHQGRTKHNPQVTGTHLVVLLQLYNPDEKKKKK